MQFWQCPPRYADGLACWWCNLYGQYTKINFKTEYNAVKLEWAEQHTREGCAHFNCKKEDCIYGSRHKKGWLIKGAVLGVWNAINSAIDKKLDLKLDGVHGIGSLKRW